MKKDLESYQKHNEGYVTDTSYYTKEAILKRAKEEELFKRVGFPLGIEMTSVLPPTHVDIGSGVGWLVREMSPYFKKTIGIEPSLAAVEAAKNLTSELTNVSFIQEDMIEGYKKLDLSSPMFFTTAAVLSHIENYYVIEFLKLLNEAPYGSVLYFAENYDRNMDWRMWHIRSQEWWCKHLPAWQLVFMNVLNDGYPSGIYGVKRDQVYKAASRGYLWSLTWQIDGFRNHFNRIVKKLIRMVQGK